MNKKIPIGCILSVVILILVSFTSVVGYRSGASDVTASPLFNIRSSRAIDEESKDLSCEHVGKGEEISLLIPKRDGKIGIIQTIIDRLQAMNDEIFNQFINLIIHKIQNNDGLKDVKNDDIIFTLNILRNHQELTFSNNTNMNGIYTIRFEFIPTICWFPGCSILISIFLIFAVIVVILLIPILTIAPLSYCYCPSVNMPCLNRNLLK